MKKLAFIFFSFSPLLGYSTAQFPDVLYWENDTIGICSNPLESYLDSKKERTIGGQDVNWTSTACYRGYSGFWQIQNDSLFLIRLKKGCTREHGEFSLEKEFGQKKVFANWFSSEIRGVKGKCLHYVHSGYDSYYEKEIIFSIVNGKLVKVEKFDNSPTYISNFVHNNDTLLSFFTRNLDITKFPPEMTEPVTVYVSVESGGDRKPHNIEILRPSKYPVINQEILRVFGLIDDWDVYYRRGKFEPVKVALPITVGL